MVEIEEILLELDKIKSVTDKIAYLEKLLKTLKDKDLIESINDIIIELKFPQEFSGESRFSVPEEVEEIRGVKEQKLENIVRFEEKEEEETKQVEYFKAGTLYEGAGNPFVDGLKRNLESKGIFKDGMFVTGEQKVMMREEIQKYSPGLSEDSVEKYIGMLEGDTEKQYKEFVPMDMIQRIEMDLKREKKYIPRVEAK